MKMPTLPEFSDKWMAEKVFLVNVQDHLARSVIMWISKAMICCRQQDRDGVLLQVVTVFH